MRRTAWGIMKRYNRSFAALSPKPSPYGDRIKVANSGVDSFVIRTVLGPGDSDRRLESVEESVLLIQALGVYTARPEVRV